MYKFRVEIEYSQYSTCEVIEVPKSKIDSAKINPNIIIQRHIRKTLNKKGLVDWKIYSITKKDTNEKIY